MGLDNGIVLKRASVKGDIPFEECEYHKGESEIMYWRKTWGIRNEILDAIGGDVRDSGEYALTPENVEDIIKILKRFNSEETWNYEADSIWDWGDNVAETLKEQIDNLTKLKNMMKDQPDIEAYFYDSW